MTATRTETAAPRPTGGGRGWLPARFTREVIAELRKVLRPSRKELLTYTAVVIVFVVVMVVDRRRPRHRFRQAGAAAVRLAAPTARSAPVST